MDLRSYLRGLGVGIAVTTIVLTVSFAVSAKEPDSEEIIRRAKALGMVESTAFMPSTRESAQAQGEEKQSAEKTQEATVPSSGGQETTAETERTEEAVTEESAEASTEASGEVPTEEPTEGQAENVTEAGREEPLLPVETMAPIVDGDRITVEIRNFTQAYIAAEFLQEFGVIDDAMAFTAYLVDNDYSTRVCEGVYTFTRGMSHEQVARIICWDE